MNLLNLFIFPYTHIYKLQNGVQARLVTMEFCENGGAIRYRGSTVIDLHLEQLF